MSAVLSTAAAPAQAYAALAEPRFELIPIKGMLEQAAALPPGSRVSVTCSPKLGLERTLETAIALRERGFQVVPHLAARLVQDGGHLAELLERLARAGLAEVFLVGGDSPQPAGKFAGVLSLLEAMDDADHRPARIGVTCYPEGHASIPAQVLSAALGAKVRHADYMVSQLCFESGPILEWLAATRAGGVGLPLYVGLPGVMDARRLWSIALQIGLGTSTRVLRRNSSMLGRLLGPEYQPDDLIWELAEPLGEPALGFAGFHLNTFNQVRALEQWRAAMLAQFRGWYGEAVLETQAQPEPLPVLAAQP